MGRKHPARYKVEAHSWVRLQLAAAEGGGAQHVALRVHIHIVSISFFLYNYYLSFSTISGVHKNWCTRMGMFHLFVYLHGPHPHLQEPLFYSKIVSFTFAWLQTEI